MKLRAHAKMNLDLLVTGRREDGYHDLSTVMCELPLFDTVRMFIHPLKPKTAYKTPAPLKADQDAPAVAKANQDAPAISKANQEASVPSKILGRLRGKKLHRCIPRRRATHGRILCRFNLIVLR